MYDFLNSVFRIFNFYPLSETPCDQSTTVEGIENML